MNEQSTLELDDEFADCALPDAVEQRPNAVIKNGGPQLLQGLRLPMPPSKNRCYLSMPMVKKGTSFPMVVRSFKELMGKIRCMTFPSTAAKDYFKWIKEHAIQRGYRFGTQKMLRLDLVVCPRDRRKIDAHNYSEVMLDAFQEAGVYEDDSQIEELRVRLGPVVKEGCIIVSLWEITPDHNAILKEAWR